MQLGNRRGTSVGGGQPLEEGRDGLVEDHDSFNSTAKRALDSQEGVNDADAVDDLDVRTEEFERRPSVADEVLGAREFPG